jgi:hypothetical protein
MSTITRRKLLAASAAGAGGVLAGCLGDDGAENGEESPTEPEYSPNSDEEEPEEPDDVRDRDRPEHGLDAPAEAGDCEVGSGDRHGPGEREANDQRESEDPPREDREDHRLAGVPGPAERALNDHHAGEGCPEEGGDPKEDHTLGDHGRVRDEDPDRRGRKREQDCRDGENQHHRRRGRGSRDGDGPIGRLRAEIVLPPPDLAERLLEDIVADLVDETVRLGERNE